MGTQQFCLKWNNHQANMLTVFEHLLSNEALVDVTLACEGLSIKAHKMVLSACSPFFQTLFLENPCKHPIVIMKDMRYTDLKAIIDFMYRGEVNVSQDQLSALLKTAETLKVKGLAEVTGENNKPGGPNSLVQQEVVQNSPATLSGTNQNRAESPPLNRRKRGRPRRRSLSGSNLSDSEDQVPSKIIKEPDSPEVIEDLSHDELPDPMDVHHSKQNHIPQVSSHLPSVHSSLKNLPSVLPQGDNTHNSEPPSGDEGDFDLEPSKLMEQTLTTDNMIYPDGPNSSSLPSVSVSSHLAIPSSDSQSHQGPMNDNQALVPCSMPSDPSNSSHITDDSSQDIKPGNLVSYEDPPISPIAGTSHQDNSNSSMMMYMDSSGVPAIPGPSNYQLDKSSSSQPQGGRPARGRGGGYGNSLRYQDLICPFCNKSFSNKSNFDGHLMMHTSHRKKYRCDICNKSFLWRNNVYAHKRKIHKVPSSRPANRFSSFEMPPPQALPSPFATLVAGDGNAMHDTPSVQLLKAVAAEWNRQK